MLTQAMSRMDLTKDWALLCPEGLPHSAATYAFAYRALVFMNTSCWYEMAAATSPLSARHLAVDEGVHKHAQVLHAVEAISSVGMLV